MRFFGKGLFKGMPWGSKELWKDVVLVVVLGAVLYVVYVAVEYWPEITEGFNRGWNSR